jgi:hypothetical protein
MLQQGMQSQPFLCFLAEAGQQAGGPHDWLRHSEAALSSWREAEEALAAGTAQPAAARRCPARRSSVRRPRLA